MRGAPPGTPASMMFSGLRSRWTIPAPWTTAGPAHTSATPGQPSPPPDASAVWHQMRGLLSRLVQAVDRGSFLDDCLDTLVELLCADRGLVLLFHDDGSSQAVNARGKGRALDAFEREEISKTI